MKTEKFQLFEDRKNVTLTTYILEDSPEILNGKKRPLILVCPGGPACSARTERPNPSPCVLQQWDSRGSAPLFGIQ